ncbi:hypothetical protein [Clostridium sp. BJN0013]|uniref:hypothetical protein n=1 Tax=Clostridium sp. BJN0013 TaxID=3236840 RepID=UPI0034C5CD19
MPLSSIHVPEDVNAKLLRLNFDYKNSYKQNEILLNPNLEPVFKDEAKKWILNHPDKFFKLGIIRVRNTFFKGAADIYEWAIDSVSPKRANKLLRTNFIHLVFDRYIYILSFGGFIYVLFNLKNVLLSLFFNKYKLNYEISIPFFNIAFFILIPFVFEGQPRYNFPVLFLLAICTTNYIEKIFNFIKNNQLITNLIGRLCLN